MDFGDILRIFAFILIPIIIKASKESKKAKQKNANSYKRTPVNTQRTSTQPHTASPVDYVPPWKQTEPKREMKPEPKPQSKPQRYNEEDHIKPAVSLESKGYNEEDYIKQRASLESKEYTIRERAVKKEISRGRKDRIRDVIKDNEIGSEGLNLRFDRADLVKGIVMSEILSKPKSLRR